MTQIETDDEFTKQKKGRSHQGTKKCIFPGDGRIRKYFKDQHKSYADDQHDDNQVYKIKQVYRRGAEKILQPVAQQIQQRIGTRETKNKKANPINKEKEISFLSSANKNAFFFGAGIDQR